MRVYTQVVSWVLWTYILNNSYSIVAVKECHKLDQCRYSTDTGKVNLWSLAGTGGKPSFNISDDESKFEFYLWDPCKNWTQHNTSSVVTVNECHNVSLCLAEVIPVGTWYKKLGSLINADYVLDNDTGLCSIVYVEDAGNITRKTSISLSCNSSEDGRVDPMKTVFVDTYHTVLHTKLVCQGLSTSAKSSSLGAMAIAGIVLGSIAFLSLLLLIVAYKLGRSHNPDDTLRNKVKVGCFKVFCFRKNSNYTALN